MSVLKQGTGGGGPGGGGPTFGSQTPRIHSVPTYAYSDGQDAIELAAAAGLHLDPWQQGVLMDALGRNDRDGWAAFEVGVVVPRQNGKGALVEARELAGLFLFGERLILHSAHEFKTAQEAFRRVLSLVEGTDWLRKKVARVRTSHGEEGIELTDGARLRFVARSGGSGRGFTGDCLILDEAMILAAQAMAALLPTLSARPNPQVWYTGSAGLESSEQLRRVRARGMAGDSPSLAYFEWSAPEDADLDDLEAQALANPALG
jgi:phage terminase large subunit-like protein